VDRAVAGLQEVDMSGDLTRLVAGGGARRIERLYGNDGDAVFVFKRRDIVFAKPDRNLNGNRNAVVGQHEALQSGVPVAVGCDARNDPRSRVRRGVFLFDHGEAIKGEKIVREFRGACAVVALEEAARTGAGHILQKIGERSETCIALAAVVKRALAQEGELGAVV